MASHAREFDVAGAGDDAADGSATNPLRSIQAAAGRAMPGDVVTVREGVYRERIDPPRGGTSDDERIVYQAVFYQSKTGRNFITVRGFTLEHAATNWAPPTAEQVGLIGTHWSKGWIIEVNHGPFLVDHNLFLSAVSLRDWSQGGAYTHNLFAGKVIPSPVLRRETPWQEEHGTAIAGMSKTQGGDNRFYNHVFIAPAGLEKYDHSARPNQMAGNVFLKGAKPSRHEESPLVLSDFDPAVCLREDGGKWLLEVDSGWGGKSTGPLVTSELLGNTGVSDQAYVQPDGSPLRLDRDFIGVVRSETSPSPVPFEARPGGRQSIKLWPPQR